MKCESCGNETNTKKYNVRRSSATICKELCDNCAEELVKSGEVSVFSEEKEELADKAAEENEFEQQGEEEEESNSSMSTVFLCIAIAIAIIGIIVGIVLGYTFPKISIDNYLSSSITEQINIGLVLTTWCSTAILFLIFLAVYYILYNQEKMLKLLDNSRNNEMNSLNKVEKIDDEEKTDDLTA